MKNTTEVLMNVLTDDATAIFHLHLRKHLYIVYTGKAVLLLSTHGLRATDHDHNNNL